MIYKCLINYSHTQTYKGDGGGEEEEEDCTYGDIPQRLRLS